MNKIKVERKIRNHLYSFEFAIFESKKDGKSYGYYRFTKKSVITKDDESKTSFVKWQGPITVSTKDIQEFTQFLIEIIECIEGNKEW